MWSTGYSAHRSCEPASTASVAFGLRGSGNDGVGWVVGWTRCWVLRKRALPGDLGLRDQSPHHPQRVVWRWWARLFFENCTVDASISGETSLLSVPSSGGAGGWWGLVCDLF